ncbi:low temperature requirement protein A [Longivirga aurantiaca]|uniref:Low temperature requirement protein A n=1 Tax=Longivirga aurantiaca TaxID=1837743 RepID=A0ABW1SXJ9_9ACTN
MSEQPVVVERRVTPLELFFDLVFVFSLTQVTALMAADPTWLGLLRGMAVLTVLWWAWVAYVWIGTTTDAEDGVARIVMLAAMGAMFLTALAAPGAFGQLGDVAGGSRDQALLFGVTYFAVRLAHVVLFRVIGRDKPDVGAAVARLAPGLLLGSALILVAAFLPPGWPRGLLWAVAIAVDVGAPLVAGTKGWELSPHHFAERHGLVIIIALGESLVALGVGVSDQLYDVRTMIAVLVGFASVACLWWLYFDVVAIAAERRLASVDVEQRNRLARDSFNYFHLPMVAGIVLLALGLKKSFVDIDSELKLVASFALFGGVALYLLGHLLFRKRNMGSWNLQRTVIMLLLLACVPLGVAVPAWVSLVTLMSVLLALVTYETLAFAPWRRHLRAAHEDHHAGEH